MFGNVPLDSVIALMFEWIIEIWSILICYTDHMNQPDQTLFAIQQMMIDLSLIDRRHYIPHTKRRENDIEHSMTVVILAWYIYEKYHLDLDISKVLKYALTHDFVERHAGDVPTFASKEERANKVLREQESLQLLSDEFKGFNDMVVTMQQYEMKEDDESLFVWTVDKIQALVMGSLDEWRSYAEEPIRYDAFIAKYAELLAKSSKYCREIFESIIEYSKDTYYEKV